MILRGFPSWRIQSFGITHISAMSLQLAIREHMGNRANQSTIKGAVIFLPAPPPLRPNLRRLVATKGCVTSMPTISPLNRAVRAATRGGATRPTTPRRVHFRIAFCNGEVSKSLRPAFSRFAMAYSANWYNRIGKQTHLRANRYIGPAGGGGFSAPPRDVGYNPNRRSIVRNPEYARKIGAFAIDGRRGASRFGLGRRVGLSGVRYGRPLIQIKKTARRSTRLGRGGVAPDTYGVGPGRTSGVEGRRWIGYCT